MPKTKTASTVETPEPVETPYIEDPATRCGNVAGRLQAVLILLDGCIEGDHKGDEGWTLATIRDLLKGMQDDLRQTIAVVDAEIAAAIAAAEAQSS